MVSTYLINSLRCCSISYFFISDFSFLRLFCSLFFDSFLPLSLAYSSIAFATDYSVEPELPLKSELNKKFYTAIFLSDSVINISCINYFSLSSKFCNFSALSSFGSIPSSSSGSTVAFTFFYFFTLQFFTFPNPYSKFGGKFPSFFSVQYLRQNKLGC